MTPMDCTIIGLGNPGSEYLTTRHNLGFWVVERVAQKLKVRLKPGRGDFEIAERRLHGGLIRLAQPTTYMNLSGLAVTQIINLYKLTERQVLVVCDDFALEEGYLRLRKKGSDGGHNGLKSIIEDVGTVEFPRLRLGIGPVPEGEDPADFVLAQIEENVIHRLRQMADRASEAVMDYIFRGFGFTANKYNTKPSAPAEKADGAERPREV